MLRFLKEIYLTAFTIFFRLGISSTPAWDKGRGAAGVALIQGLFLIGAASWIGMIKGTKSLFDISKGAAIIGLLILGASNYYVLVICGLGTVFEREFRHLQKSRRTLLLGTCVAIMLATIAFFIYSVVVYRRFIGKS